jgi:hypothetical protein
MTVIPIRHSALREAPVPASPEPRVCSIGYIASAVVATEQQVDLGAVVLERDDGRFLLDVVQLDASTTSTKKGSH